jgi:hypothetical protein
MVDLKQSAMLPDTYHMHAWYVQAYEIINMTDDKCCLVLTERNEWDMVDWPWSRYIKLELAFFGIISKFGHTQSHSVSGQSLTEITDVTQANYQGEETFCPAVGQIGNFLIIFTFVYNSNCLPVMSIYPLNLDSTGCPSWGQGSKQENGSLGAIQRLFLNTL